MARMKMDMRKELENMQFDIGLLQKIDCSKEDNKKYKKMLKNGESLPEGVFQYMTEDTGYPLDTFYTVYKPDLTDAEKQEYILHKQYLDIRTIRRCIVFFTALTVISLLLNIIIGLSGR